MKTATITVNKTAETPEGVEIEIVQPESDLEGRLLAFLLRDYLVQLKHNDRIPYDLPQGFSVQHQGEGTFVVLGFAQPKDEQQPEQPGYYKPPQPLAIVGIRTAGNQFDIIHAAVDVQKMQAAAQAAAETSNKEKTDPADG